MRIILRSYDDDAAGAPATRSEKVEQQRKTAREHLWLIYLARCTKYYTRSVRIIPRAVFYALLVHIYELSKLIDSVAAAAALGAT